MSITINASGAVLRVRDLRALVEHVLEMLAVGNPGDRIRHGFDPDAFESLAQGFDFAARLLQPGFELLVGSVT